MRWTKKNYPLPSYLWIKKKLCIQQQGLISNVLIAYDANIQSDYTVVFVVDESKLFRLFIFPSIFLGEGAGDIIINNVESTHIIIDHIHTHSINASTLEFHLHRIDFVCSIIIGCKYAVGKIIKKLTWNAEYEKKSILNNWFRLWLVYNFWYFGWYVMFWNCLKVIIRSHEIDIYAVADIHSTYDR